MKTVELYGFYKKSLGISIDSRSIQPENLFFALKGPNFDGHKYIDSAFENGAKYAVIDDPKYKDNPNTLLVKNVEVALQNLARFHRSMISIPVIGITGSNGKTTTKELLASVLETQYSVFATKGNFNNHLGVPLCVLSIVDTHEIAIIEMGANHVGEIKFLSEIAMPNIGIITNIGKAHLEGFGSLEGVRIGKTELYDYLDKVNGTIMYNKDDKLLINSLPSHTQNIGYTISSVDKIADYPFLQYQFKNIKIKSNLSGNYNLINMISTLSLGEYFNISVSDIKKGIENYIPENNRSQVKKTNNNTLILDAYNANPSSMEESIKNFYCHPGDKKTLILGHMLELGNSAKEEHKKLVEFISSFEWNQVFLVGSEFKKIEIPSPIKVFSDYQSLCKTLKLYTLQNNLILLKGSRGVALENCIEFL